MINPPDPSIPRKPWETDQQRVLNALDEYGPLSRRELSIATGIPGPNLSSPLKRLKRWELVVIIGTCQPAGRRAFRYALSNRFFYVPYEFMSRLVNAKRYKAGDLQLINADFADEAGELLRGVQSS